MGKPSIFSREYEKQMKKRKRNILLFSLLIMLVVSAIVVKLAYNPIDFTKVKQNLQKWIDSDTSSKITNVQNKVNKGATKTTEIVEKPEKNFIDVKLASGNVAKAIYIEKAKKQKKFIEVKNLDKGVTYDISPSKNKIIINDINGNITLYNIDGSSLVISKNEYTSTKGVIFKKTDVLASNPNYLWNYNPKFISDEKIAFITNRPYFGMNVLKQYIWITDISSSSDKVIWNLVGSKIELSTIQEKGLKVIVDGKEYYLDEYGNCNQ